MSEAQTPAQVNANVDATTSKEKFVFRFKRDKLGSKRPNLELEVPVLNFAGLVSVLEKGGKGAELILEATTDVIRNAVAGWVSETKPEDATQEKLPLAQFSWDAIANQDKKDRRTVTIDEETWAGFASDYVEVMKRIQPNRTEENHKAAVQVFLAKFSMFKTDKKILGQLKQALTLYMENTEKGEEYSDVLELLTRRLENYLAADDTAALAAALG
jgi:hypothetical protein